MRILLYSLIILRCFLLGVCEDDPILAHFMSDNAISEESNITTDTQGFCETGWTHFEESNKCFKIIYGNFSGFKAMELCESLNAFPASIHSEKENSFLINLTLPIPSVIPSYSFWIGMVLTNYCARRQWLDGSPLDFAKWGISEPYGTAESFTNTTNATCGNTPTDTCLCTTLVTGGNDHGYGSNMWYGKTRWTANFCDRNNRRFPHNTVADTLVFPYGVICQKQAMKNVTLVKVSQIELNEMYCNNGWQYFEGSQSCYYVVYGNLNYFDAAIVCESLNASLTSIHSGEENEFVSELPTPGLEWLDYSFWIGLTHNYATDWEWMDGTPVDYEIFGRGYLTNFDSVNLTLVKSLNLICARLAVDGMTIGWAPSRLLWADSLCTDNLNSENTVHGAICKRPAGKNGQNIGTSDMKSSNQQKSNGVQGYDAFEFSPIYKSTLDNRACKSPPKQTASMIVAIDSKHYSLNWTQDPIAICPCSDGNRMYWPSSEFSLPTEVFHAKQLAMILYDYDMEYGQIGFFDGVHNFSQDGSNIERRDMCEHLCVCDIDGTCYEAFQYNTEVLFIPYCEENGTECYVYGGISSGNLCRGRKTDDFWGCINQDTTKERVGRNSSYIKVEKVGCRGCYDLLNLQCPTNDISGVPGWPSLIETTVIVSKVVYAPLDANMYGNPWNYRMAKAQALDWRPYVINPRILSEAYATDAFKEIVYECVFFYGLRGELASKPNDPNYNVTSRLFSSDDNVQLEIEMEQALKTGIYSNLGGNCTSLNYGRFKDLKPELHNRWAESIAVFNNYRIANIFLAFVFGAMGMVLVILILNLIRKQKELQNVYGIICAVQACNEILLLSNSLILEGLKNIKAVLMDANIFFSDDVLSIFGWKLDRLMFYIFYSSKFTVIWLTFLKSISRLIAIMFPLYFDKIFTDQRTIVYCLGGFITVVTAALPLLILPGSCITAFSRSQYLMIDSCSKYYWWVQIYSEYAFALICFVFDIITALKMYKFHKQFAHLHSDTVAKNKKLQERMFILQNFGNLATIIVLFIPHLIYMLACNYDRWHCIVGGENQFANTVYRISSLLFLYNSRIAIWRFGDELITFLCQRRIVKLYQNPDAFKSVSSAISSNMTNR